MNDISRVIRHWQWVGLIVLWILATNSVSAAGLEASLDRTRIAEGETVLLKVSADTQVDGMPDLSPLVLDFEVLDRRQSSRIQVINGRSRSWQEWDFILAPRRSGQLEIPSLRLGKLSSQPLRLDVYPADQAAQAGLSQPVTLEIEVNPEQPYLQSQVDYVVRVLSNVPLRKDTLSDPVAEHAIIQRLGEDQKYQTVRAGQRYYVIERRYAVFPQRSGQLTLKGPLFQAQVPQPPPPGANQPRRDFGPGSRDPFNDFDRLFFGGRSGPDRLFSRTRLTQLRGRLVTLDVLPQPAGTASPWLPADSLRLQQRWQPDPPGFRVGEPVTRSVEMVAEGLTESQLPELTLESVSGITVYPDKGESVTQLEDGKLVARRRFTAAYVPAAAGRHVLPAITVAWWDKQAGEQRVAELPAMTVQVMPGSGGQAGSGGRSLPAQPPLQPQPQAQSETGETTGGQSVQPGQSATESMPGGSDAQGGFGLASPESPGIWPWLAAAFALAWVVTLLLWLRGQRPTARVDGAPVTRVSPSRGERPGAAASRFKQACEADDPQAARKALIEWAEERWPHQPPRRLDDLAQHLPIEAMETLGEIDRVLYAREAGSWKGEAAWRVLDPVMRSTERREASTESALPPLYPGEGST